MDAVDAMAVGGISASPFVEGVEILRTLGAETFRPRGRRALFQSERGRGPERNVDVALKLATNRNFGICRGHVRSFDLKMLRCLERYKIRGPLLRIFQD